MKATGSLSDKMKFCMIYNSIDAEFCTSASNSLPQKLNELYNAGIYGQEITSLIDKLVLPATEIANQRHLANLREVKSNRYHQNH
jgi:hypothetical protein